MSHRRRTLPWSSQSTGACLLAQYQWCIVWARTNRINGFLLIRLSEGGIPCSPVTRVGGWRWLILKKRGGKKNADFFLHRGVLFAFLFHDTQLSLLIHVDFFYGCDYMKLSLTLVLAISSNEMAIWGWFATHIHMRSRISLWAYPCAFITEAHWKITLILKDIERPGSSPRAW